MEKREEVFTVAATVRYRKSFTSEMHKSTQTFKNLNAHTNKPNKDDEDGVTQLGWLRRRRMNFLEKKRTHRYDVTSVLQEHLSSMVRRKVINILMSHQFLRKRMSLCFNADCSYSVIAFDYTLGNKFKRGSEYEKGPVGGMRVY